MDRVKGAAAVGQRICHELRSVEAVFVDQRARQIQGSDVAWQMLAVQVLKPAVARRARRVDIWRTGWCSRRRWLACD